MSDQNNDSQCLTDTQAIELIAGILGREEQWSSDEIEDIAAVILRVRPTLSLEDFRYPEIGTERRFFDPRRASRTSRT